MTLSGELEDCILMMEANHGPGPKYKGGWQITSLAGGRSDQSLLPPRLKVENSPNVRSGFGGRMVQNGKYSTNEGIEQGVL